MRKFLTRCPAKLNLKLHIREKDSRGYHPLDTVFLAISLFDELEVTVKESGAQSTFEYFGDELPLENTLTKTLRLSQELALIPPLHVKLTKVIPSRAGLGGGSSDAAGLIRILKKLTGTKVTNLEWADLAATIGADVPFFLTGGLAQGGGYGEKISPIPNMNGKWYLLLIPEEGSSTPEMYQKLDTFWLARKTKSLSSSWMENDFHYVITDEQGEKLNQLAKIIEKPVSLSGSGSAFFGELDNQEEGNRAIQRILVEETLSSCQILLVQSLSREECLLIEEI